MKNQQKDEKSKWGVIPEFHWDLKPVLLNVDDLGKGMNNVVAIFLIIRGH